MKKFAIVTGGSGGIGLNIIKHFKTLGIESVSWDVKPPEEAGIRYIHCDVSQEVNVQAAFTETLKLYSSTCGEPNILINNCGVQHISPIDEFSIEKWNFVMGIVLTGTFLCTKAIIPALKKQKWGRVVNISSIHGKVASPYKSAYVSAKHGVIGFSKVAALELAEHGVTVNSICPGFVDTQLMRQQISTQAKMNHMPEDKVISEIMLKPACVKEFTTPQQVADMVAFLVSDSASTITGEAFSMSGGWGMGQ